MGHWTTYTEIMRTKENCWSLSVPRSTPARSTRRRAVLVALLTAAVVLGPSIGVIGNASAITIPGLTGFITNDGLFFVEVGYSQFGLAEYVTNGSEVYASGLVLNITGITQYQQTAHVTVYDYASNRVVASENVPIPGYTSTGITVSLPNNHTWTEYRIDVDSTPWWVYQFTPYSFLGFTQLQDGGADLATFIAIGLFLAYCIPLMVLGERWTKRAIYSPRWNATLFLHGIFFGMVAWYFVNFPSINMFWKGWEFVIIPIPEALFLFFWSAGRHSTNSRALFVQVVPRLGQRLGVIMRSYFIGKDADGDMVIMRGHSPIQWYYRAHGHHVKLFRRSEAGALEPFPLDVLAEKRVTAEEVRDPMRFPRSGKFDAHDDFPVINSDSSEDRPFERVYFVPRISAFKVVWPRARVTKEITIQAHTDLATGTVVPEEKKTVWCWPYIQDGHAEVQLCSWHFMDVLAQAMGYMTAEDLAAECDNLAMQLWTERGFRATETSRKADERTTAEEDIRNRPDSDLPEEDLEKFVVSMPGRRDNKARDDQQRAVA